jgi:hypothetical protein
MPVKSRSRRSRWRAGAIALVASAGTTLTIAFALTATPAASLASTFPILAERMPDVPLASLGMGDPQFGQPTTSDWTDFVRTADALNQLPAAVRDAHPFTIPATYAPSYGANAAGYVAVTRDGRRLCLGATVRRWRTQGRDHDAFGAPICAQTASVERYGLVDVIRHSTAVYGGIAVAPSSRPVQR